MDFKSKSDIVSASLREMIITGQLEPSARLRQRDLAEQFGVSPTPVREALRRLESEGLVHYDVHRGATVIGGSLAASDENYCVRAALESFAARLAAARISADEVDRLETIHEEIAACLEAEEADVERRFHELNREFHFGIYAASRSPLLLALLRLLWQSFPVGPRDVRPLAESIAQHAAIVDALKRRDAAACARATQQHILGAVGLETDELFATIAGAPDGALLSSDADS